MTNNPSSVGRALFAFNFWENEIKISDIIGSNEGPGPLSDSDGLFGISEGAYQDLASKWKAFMISKALNMLYRFNTDTSWMQFCALVSYLNQDLANVGSFK